MQDGRHGGRPAAGAALLPPPAGASGLRGTGSGTGSVTSASWGVTASVTSMTFTNDTDQTSDATNTGTVALVAESFAVTVSKPLFGAPSFVVYECARAWTPGHLCPGGSATRVGGTLSTGTATITASTALAVGGVVYLQVEPTGVLFPTKVTIATLVTAPTQLRAGTTTNQ